MSSRLAGKGACACHLSGFQHPASAVAPRGHRCDEEASADHVVPQQGHYVMQTVNSNFAIGPAITTRETLHRFRSWKSLAALLTVSMAVLPVSAMAQFAGPFGNVFGQVWRQSPPPVSVPRQSTSAPPTAPYPGESTAEIAERSAPRRVRYNERLPMDTPPLPWFQYSQDTYTHTIVPGMLAGLSGKTFISLDCQIRLSSPNPDDWSCVADEVLQHQQLITQHNAEVAAQMRTATQAAAQAARDENDPRVHAARVHASKLRLARFTSQLRQEQQIGRISGVVDMQTLHSWGQNIAIVQAGMEREYSLYRKTGGTKPLSAL